MDDPRTRRLFTMGMIGSTGVGLAIMGLADADIRSLRGSFWFAILIAGAVYLFGAIRERK